jgi:mRNA interferase MazF
MHPRRGEVWWVRLDPTQGSEIAKTRSCVVVSSDVLNARRRTLVVIPLSSGPQPAPPLCIRVHCSGRPVVAVVDQIRAAAKERFEGILAELSAAEMIAIETGLLQVLGMY